MKQLIEDFLLKKIFTEVPKLKPVKPESGWLMDKWRQDSIPQSNAASFTNFKGDRKTASWVFDKKRAKATEQFYAQSRGKKSNILV